jgi:hypothetical protein
MSPGHPDNRCTLCLRQGHRASHCPDAPAVTLLPSRAISDTSSEAWRAECLARFEQHIKPMRRLPDRQAVAQYLRDYRVSYGAEAADRLLSDWTLDVQLRRSPT